MALNTAFLMAFSMVVSLFHRLAARIAALYGILNIKTSGISYRFVEAYANHPMDLDKGIIPNPRAYKESAKNAEVEIWTFHGPAEKLKIYQVLWKEVQNTALVNKRFFEEDIEGQMDLSYLTNVVYIVNFFECGADFIYCVRGKVNFSKFMAATFSGNPYQRPVFATPVTLHDNGAVLFFAAKLPLGALVKASKTDTKGLRWKYLYETGVRAWNDLDIDWEKIDRLKLKAAKKTSKKEHSDGDTVMSIETDEKEAAAGDVKAGLDSGASSPSLSTLDLSDNSHGG